MYITIEVDGDVITYNQLAQLRFSPQADVIGDSLPINEFQADVHTEDDIDIGQYACLYDDRDNLWAKYWIIYAEHIDATTVRVRAQSDVRLLDRVRLGSRMLFDYPLTFLLDITIVPYAGGSPLTYTLDESFENVSVSGFYPEQTARERLMWICFCIGACVKTCFNECIEIVPIDDTAALIPKGQTYWKPSITYNDWVTSIRAQAHTYTLGTPTATDEWVEDENGYVYIDTKTEVEITNPYAPEGAPENVVDYDIQCMTEDNISDIMNRLADWHFARGVADVDIINNGDYKPGDMVQACLDDVSMIQGYITSVSFEFGLQAKGKLKLVGAESLDAGNLRVVYLDGERQIGLGMYMFPIDYVYSIANPYITLPMGGHWFCYRPENEYCTGTMESEYVTVEEPCDIALDLTYSTGELEVISVDEVTTETDDGVTIGVIA